MKTAPAFPRNAALLRSVLGTARAANPEQKVMGLTHVSATHAFVQLADGSKARVLLAAGEAEQLGWVA